MAHNNLYIQIKRQHRRRAQGFKKNDTSIISQIPFYPFFFNASQNPQHKPYTHGTSCFLFRFLENLFDFRYDPIGQYLFGEIITGGIESKSSAMTLYTILPSFTSMMKRLHRPNKPTLIGPGWVNSTSAARVKADVGSP